jgi:hypothetical protein
MSTATETVFKEKHGIWRDPVPTELTMPYRPYVDTCTELPWATLCQGWQSKRPLMASYRVKTGFLSKGLWVIPMSSMQHHFKRVANQWIAARRCRFHSNQFKTSFYLPAVIERLFRLSAQSRPLSFARVDFIPQSGTKNLVIVDCSIVFKKI